MDRYIEDFCRVKMYYKIEGRYPSIEQVFSNFDKAFEFSKQCQCSKIEIYDINGNLLYSYPGKLAKEEITEVIHKTLFAWLTEKLYKRLNKS